VAGDWPIDGFELFGNDYYDPQIALQKATGVRNRRFFKDFFHELAGETFARPFADYYFQGEIDPIHGDINPNGWTKWTHDSVVPREAYSMQEIALKAAAEYCAGMIVFFWKEAHEDDGQGSVLGVNTQRVNAILRFAPVKRIFGSGDRQEKWVDVAGGDSRPVRTYVRMRRPDGSLMYAFYPGPFRSPQDALQFSDNPKPLYQGAWRMRDSSWFWNTYTFTGSEPEGTYTWEFWHVSDLTGHRVGNVATASYEFRRSGGGAGQLPATPQTLSCQKLLGGTSVRLSWSDRANNEQGFYIERRDRYEWAAWRRIRTTAANVTTWADSGLDPSIPYWYRVQAYNQYLSGYSNIVRVNGTGAGIEAPVAPSNLTLALEGGTQIRLRWKDNSVNEYGFKIEKSEIGNVPQGYMEIARVGGDTQEFLHKGLKPATPYTYRIRAYNEYNSAYSNVATVNTPSIGSGSRPEIYSMSLVPAIAPGGDTIKAVFGINNPTDTNLRVRLVNVIGTGPNFTGLRWVDQPDDVVTVRAGQRAEYKRDLKISTLVSPGKRDVAFRLAEDRDGATPFEAKWLDDGLTVGARGSMSPAFTSGPACTPNFWTNGAIRVIWQAVNPDDQPFSATGEIDGVGVGTVSSPWTLPSLADGSHRIRVTITDTPHNHSSEKDCYALVDKTPPTGKFLTQIWGNTIIGDDPTIFADVFDPLSGVERVTFKARFMVDDMTSAGERVIGEDLLPAYVAPPFNGRFDAIWCTGGVPDQGGISFSITAIDKAGNQSGVLATTSGIVLARRPRYFQTVETLVATAGRTTSGTTKALLFTAGQTAVSNATGTGTIVRRGFPVAGNLNKPPTRTDFPYPRDRSLTAMASKITLSWIAADPNLGDGLTYDVYAKDVTTTPTYRRCDLTEDGYVNKDDETLFGYCFAAGDPLADWNRNGTVEASDQTAFKTQYAAEFTGENCYIAMTRVNTGQTPTTFSLTSAMTRKRYIWRVDVSDSHGEKVPGAVWQFQTAPAPAAPFVAAEPAFVRGLTNTIWFAPRTGSAGCLMEWSTGPLFTTLAGSSDWTTRTYYTAANLRDGETYYYRVCARSAEGVTGPWSPVVHSRQDATPPTVPGKPVAGALFTSQTTITFRWAASSDAVSGMASYGLQIGTTPGSNDILNLNVGNVLSRAITGSNGQRLFAHVRAHDKVDNISAWSPNSDGVTIDTVRPRLIEALSAASSRNIVMVTFDEPVANADQASNYTCTGGLSILGAARVKDWQYRLITSNQITGQTYTLTVKSAVKDRAGNPVDSAYCQCAFSGGGRTAAESWMLYR